MYQEFFSIVGITFSFVLAIVMLKRKRFIYLGIVFGLCGLILFEDYLWHTKLIEGLPQLVEAFAPLSFAIPPLLLVQFASSSRIPLTRLFLILPFISYLNFIPLYLGSLNYKQCYIKKEMLDYHTDYCKDIVIYQPTIVNEEILDFLLIALFSLLLLFLILDKSQNLKNVKPNKWTLLYETWDSKSKWLIGFALICIVIGIWFIPESYSFKSIFIPTIEAFVCIMALNSSILFEDRKQSKSYSTLKEDIANSTFQKLLTILEEPTIYSNENLTLDFVAKELNISTNKLSYIINCRSTTFRELLNVVRIRKAVEFMQTAESRKFSIEGISRKFGYKSKSTFYRKFKKQMLLTPNQYVENINKQYDSIKSN